MILIPGSRLAFSHYKSIIIARTSGVVVRHVADPACDVSFSTLEWPGDEYLGLGQTSWTKESTMG